MSQRITAKGGVVVRIGYMDFYLPNDKGVAQALQTLAKGARCEYAPWRGEMHLINMQPSDIGMQYVPEGIQIKDAPTQPEAAA